MDFYDEQFNQQQAEERAMAASGAPSEDPTKCRLFPHTKNIVKNVQIAFDQGRQIFDQLKTSYQEVQAKDNFLERVEMGNLSTAESVETARSFFSLLARFDQRH